MLNMISLGVSVVSMLLVFVLWGKNGLLIKQTKEAKSEYLNARSNNILVRGHYEEAVSTLKEVYLKNGELRSALKESNKIIEEQRELIQSQATIIEDFSAKVDRLEKDNALIKKRLNIYDEVAPHCKLVHPVKTTI